MSSFFGEDFRERADLQRRQIYHQQLLDSQSFRPEVDKDDVLFGARSHGGSASGGDGILGSIAIFLGFIVAVVGIIGVAFSAVAALPAALALLMVTRWLAGFWLGYGEAYRTSLIGIFLYIVVTVIVGFCVSASYEPSANPGILNILGGAIVELWQLATASLSSFTTGEISISRLFGLTGERAHSISVRLVAMAVFHGPGILVSATVLAMRINHPYCGMKGFLRACAVSVAIMPVSLGVAIWAAAIPFRS